MKRFIFLITTIFICTITHAQPINIDWLIGNNIYIKSTCEYGADLIVPSAPTKYGYTFNGWVSYTPIEYLESTGTQYIDTGVVQNWYNKYKVIAKISFSNTQSRQLNGIQGYVYFGVVSGHYQIAQPGDEYRNIIAYPNRFSDIYIEFDCKNNSVYFDINNIQDRATVYYSSNNLDGHFYLFNLNNLSFPCYQKISYFQLYDNDILVRDFIPVLDPAGTPCMFDKVEGKFYYNAGTGQFIAGPVIGGE